MSEEKPLSEEELSAFLRWQAGAELDEEAEGQIRRLVAEVRLWRRGSAMLTNIGPERRRALLFGRAVTHVGPPPGMKPIKE